MSTHRAKRLRIRLHSEISNDPCLDFETTPIFAKYETILSIESYIFMEFGVQWLNPSKVNCHRRLN